MVGGWLTEDDVLEGILLFIIFKLNMQAILDAHLLLREEVGGWGMIDKATNEALIHPSQAAGRRVGGSGGLFIVHPPTHPPTYLHLDAGAGGGGFGGGLDQQVLLGQEVGAVLPRHGYPRWVGGWVGGWVNAWGSG